VTHGRATSRSGARAIGKVLLLLAAAAGKAHQIPAVAGVRVLLLRAGAAGKVRHHPVAEVVKAGRSRRSLARNPDKRGVTTPGGRDA
jgi:hypothetical protein